MAMNSQVLQSSSELTSNDLQEVLDAVYSISPDNVINFGLKLGVTRDQILAFETQYNRNMKHCLREILNERLKQLPPLTWSDVLQALESRAVGEGALASSIEFQYISPSSPVRGPSDRGHYRSQSPVRGPSDRGHYRSQSPVRGPSDSGHYRSRSPVRGPSDRRHYRFYSPVRGPSDRGHYRSQSPVRGPSDRGHYRSQSPVRGPSDRGHYRSQSPVRGPSDRGHYRSHSPVRGPSDRGHYRSQSPVRGPSDLYMSQSPVDLQQRPSSDPHQHLSLGGERPYPMIMMRQTPVRVSLLSKPNMVTLRRFSTHNGVINVMQQTAARYREIGSYLLNDRSGAIVRGIEVSTRGDPVAAVDMIYARWMEEDVNCSWRKLTQCFRDCGLNSLASDMEQHFGLPSPQQSMSQ